MNLLLFRNITARVTKLANGFGRAEREIYGNVKAGLLFGFSILSSFGEFRLKDLKFATSFIIVYFLIRVNKKNNKRLVSLLY